VAAVGKDLWNRQRREVEPGVSGGGDGGKVRERERERLVGSEIWRGGAAPMVDE
jgi:hypothetical protein